MNGNSLLNCRKNFKRTLKFALKSPLLSSFFFDLKKSPTYEITFAVLLLSAFSSGNFTSFGLLFYVLCSNLAVHFEILSEELKLLGRPNSKEIDRRSGMKEIVKKHQQLLGICKELNEVYAGVFFTQLLFMTEMIAIQGFQIVMVNGVESSG